MTYRMDSGISGWGRKVFGRPGAGKFADSEDSFVLYYRAVDPRKENFSLEATFVVADASGADFLSGYGIMAVDTVAAPREDCRFRNHALVGRFRTPDGRNYSLGLRIVGGYTSFLGLRQDGRRRLDPTRTFRTPNDPDAIRTGDIHRLRLVKTDQGLEASVQTGTGWETIRFPGCDFLLRQDLRRIYVGFAVAGQMKMEITDIRFGKTPGGLSHTPRKAIEHIVPDYPFNRTLLSGADLPEGTALRRSVLRVSPGGGPQGLAAALSQAGPGCEIILSDGVYAEGPYYIPPSRSGEPGHPVILRAEHPGKAVIDGSRQREKLPALTLRADEWTIEGLVFLHAPSCGLFLCGSHNTVRGCEACFNGDTGILLCSFPGASKRSWPAWNRMEDCVSHDNCDTVRRNADGFGAKLSVGLGNVFSRCRAFHNIDDGFDLYNKSTLGPTGPVLLEDCEAACNGYLSGEGKPVKRTGSGVGFKLGGEGQRVRHRVRNCISRDNAGSGFDFNGNPRPVLEGCRAWGNAPDFVRKTSCRASWKLRLAGCLLKYCGAERILFLKKKGYFCKGEKVGAGTEGGSPD